MVSKKDIKHDKIKVTGNELEFFVVKCHVVDDFYKVTGIEMTHFEKNLRKLELARDPDLASLKNRAHQELQLLTL